MPPGMPTGGKIAPLSAAGNSNLCGMHKIVLAPHVSIETVRAVPHRIRVVQVVAGGRTHRGIDSLNDLRDLRVASQSVSESAGVDEVNLPFLRSGDQQVIRRRGQHRRTRRSEVGIVVVQILKIARCKPIQDVQ